MVAFQSSPGLSPEWALLAAVIPDAELAKRASEALLELRRDWPQQAFPELLPNGPVLWELLGCRRPSTEGCGADLVSAQEAEPKCD